MLYFLLIILLLTNAIFAYLTFYFAVKYDKLATSLERLNQEVEESLDVVDTAYRTLGQSFDNYVSSDDAVVRRIMKSVRDVQHSMLLIANKLANYAALKQKEESDESE